MSCVAEPNDRDILVRFASFLFSRLSATDQCEILTDEIRQNLAEDILKTADGLPEEDSRLRTFTEVFEKLAVAEQNLFLSSEMNIYKQEGKFWELFFWFQQLEADDQRELLEKLDPIMPGNVQIPGTSDDDTKFRIDRFNALPAGTPKIPLKSKDCFYISLISQRSCIPKQDFASAAQLLWRLCRFGFSLLSRCDRKRVAKLCTRTLLLDRYIYAEGDEDLAMESLLEFTDLHDAGSCSFYNLVFLCTEISKTFFEERNTREFIFYFRQLGTEDQEELIDELVNRLESHKLPDEDASHAIIEKFSEESEEDFRDRRFINLCVGYPFIWKFRKELNGAGKWDLRDLHETSRYTKFLNGFSNIWAKARCPNDSRNLIKVILNRDIDPDDTEKLYQGDDIEKLPDESMEDFRVRRFTESFNRLECSSQQAIVGFTESTVFQDVGIVFLGQRGGGCDPIEDRSSFVLELIKFKAPNLRGGVVPPPSPEGSEVVDQLALDFERSMG
ncbi:hypothetical protein M0R45_005776 [Rubus argutus]|uniref:Uncharacterized protein n=1 Tax=Rubus argutus TaxID=59490 RepID=A0AAW1YNI2_RUBAR